ncbi:MAG: hypothetical protein K2Y23_06330 [Cyanobacteria bacterium]|nr:hypothetical protein [Cyanobacteriota bacterium]
MGFAAALATGIVVAGGTGTAMNEGQMIRAAISFEGLVALVRSPNFDRGAVVLVDPTRSAYQPHLPSHHAMLTIPMSAVRSGTPDSFTDSTKTIGVWELANTRIEFESSATGSLRPVRTAADVTHPRTIEDWRDVKWIADMKSLAGTSEIRPSVMTAADLSSAGLNARVTLSAGTIEAVRPPEPFNRSEVRFLVLKGLTAGQPMQQAVTQSLLYTPSKAQSFAIVLRGSDGTVRRIELRATGEKTPISISNHTTMDTMMDGEMPREGVHFFAYYDLLATPTKTPVIPTALVPYPATNTAASPGFYCSGDPPQFTWSFEQ